MKFNNEKKKKKCSKTFVNFNKIGIKNLEAFTHLKAHANNENKN